MITLQIPKANYLFHLSYDIISKFDDKEKKTKEHEDLKGNLVWEVLVTKKNAIINSYVSSTIIFESPEGFNYWDNVLQHFIDDMNFVLTEVKEYYTDVTSKYFQLSINEVPDLNANFHDKIVAPEKIVYAGVGRTRTPISRVL